MRIRINLTEAKKPVDPKKAAAVKAADKKIADKKKADDKKKEVSKKKLKESLYPVVRKMLSENFTDLSQDEMGLGDTIKGISMKEDQLNEVDPSLVDWNVVAAGLGAVGLSGVIINKIHDLWKKKFPESFKKAQSFTKDMNDITGANK